MSTKRKYDKTKNRKCRITKAQLDEFNETRKEVGLPVLVSKERACMKCRQKFQSREQTNRICDLCKLSIKRYMQDNEEAWRYKISLK